MSRSPRDRSCYDFVRLHLTDYGDSDTNYYKELYTCRNDYV